MHPLEALHERELRQLSRIADQLLSSRLCLAPGQRPDRLHAGFGAEFLDHREFAPGDDIRDIDWRASARSRHPQIRRYWDEAAADWTLCLDVSASMGLDGKWALALQCTAALAYLLIHLDHRVAVLLFSDRLQQRVPLGRGYKHYARLLRILKQASPRRFGGGTDLRTCIRYVKRRSQVFVISDFLVEDGLQAGLERLWLLCERIHTLQIYALDTPPAQDEMARLQDVETGETLTVAHPDRQRQAYHQALESFGNTLGGYCRQRHIRFSRASSEQAWKPVLVEHFRRAGGMK
jgi:uncharacterized protein (DUF58 family)